MYSLWIVVLFNYILKSFSNQTINFWGKLLGTWVSLFRKKGNSSHLQSIINNSLVLHAAYSIRREIEIYTGKRSIILCHYPLLYQNKWRTIYIIHSGDFITFSRAGSTSSHQVGRCGITHNHRGDSFSRFSFCKSIAIEIERIHKELSFKLLS